MLIQHGQRRTTVRSPAVHADNGLILFTFPLAMNCDFTCQECAKPLGHFDNDMLLRALKFRIEAIKKSLGHA